MRSSVLREDRPREARSIPVIPAAVIQRVTSSSRPVRRHRGLSHPLGWRYGSDLQQVLARNPADAVYCYYDGFVLGGHSRNGGPVAVGAQAFASPFVFPTGKTCRSFNELALACQEDWKTARDLLKQGYLESFLGGLGRIDLVMAAKEAAKFPDPTAASTSS